jgi:hypothetical protein
VVKTEAGPKITGLKRELFNHRLPAIASCEYIRSLYDVIGPEEDSAEVENISTIKDPLCLVLEWMEHDLRTVRSDHFRQNSALPKIIAKPVLSALALMKLQYNGMHTVQFPAPY